MKLPSTPHLSRSGSRRPAVVAAAAIAAAALVTLAAAGCSRPAPQAKSPAHVELTLSAAASLADVLKTAVPGFEQAHPGTTVHVNLGSSGALANQIGQGAPVDVFIAAGVDPMNKLVQQGVIDSAAVQTFVANRLVLIVPATGTATVQGWADLAGPGVKHIALGDPAHVPAGQYGKATLQSLGLWDKIQSRLVFGEDVRQTLQFVEAGEADAGLVYQTDAATSNKVKVVAPAPAGSHPPIVYPIAFVKGSAHPQEAQALVAYLLGKEVASQLQAAGFEVNR